MIQSTSWKAALHANNVYQMFIRCLFGVFAAPLWVRYTLIMYIKCLFDVYLNSLESPAERHGFVDTFEPRWQIRRHAADPPPCVRHPKSLLHVATSIPRTLHYRPLQHPATCSASSCVSTTSRQKNPKNCNAKLKRHCPDFNLSHVDCVQFLFKTA